MSPPNSSISSAGASNTSSACALVVRVVVGRQVEGMHGFVCSRCTQKMAAALNNWGSHEEAVASMGACWACLSFQADPPQPTPHMASSSSSALAPNWPKSAPSSAANSSSPAGRAPRPPDRAASTAAIEPLAPLLPAARRLRLPVAVAPVAVRDAVGSMEGISKSWLANWEGLLFW